MLGFWRITLGNFCPSSDFNAKQSGAAYRDREFQMIGLKTDALLAPLRSDPRFAELVKKVGLP